MAHDYIHVSLSSIPCTNTSTEISQLVDLIVSEKLPDEEEAKIKVSDTKIEFGKDESLMYHQVALKNRDY